MPGIGGEFSCLSRLCFFVVPRVSFCPICFSCQTVELQPQGIPVKNASGADEARLLREAGAAYLRRSRPTDDPQGATGMDSRADSCGPVRSAGRHMASWPEDIFRRNTPGPLRTLSAFLPLFRLQPRADGAHVAAFRQAVREQQHGPFSPEFIAQGFSQRI